MVSSKRTGGAIDGIIEGRQPGNREHVGLPLSMVSSKGAGGAIDGFIEGRQGGREQGTPHAQWDMRDISPAICRREGVASIFFLSQSFELFNRNEGACRRYAIQQRCCKTIKKRGVPTKSKSCTTRATSESTNSTVIMQSNNSREILLPARAAPRLLWSILVSDDHAAIWLR